MKANYRPNSAQGLQMLIQQMFTRKEDIKWVFAIDLIFDFYTEIPLHLLVSLDIIMIWVMLYVYGWAG